MKIGFDIIGFSEATPGTGTVGIAGALNESLYSVSGDEITISKKANYLLGIFYNALTTPSYAILRQPKQIDFISVKSILNTELNPEAGFLNMMDCPKPLVAGDKLTAYSVNATDELTTIGCILGNGKLGRPTHIDHIIRGTCDQAITAHTWTAGTVTWNESLPAGKYEIVGILGGTYKAAAPETVLGRLVIPGYPTWRPGVPFHNMVGDKTILNKGTEAPWTLFSPCGLVFDSNVGYPNLELLGTVVNTDHVVQLALQNKGSK